MMDIKVLSSNYWAQHITHTEIWSRDLLESGPSKDLHYTHFCTTTIIVLFCSELTFVLDTQRYKQHEQNCPHTFVSENNKHALTTCPSYDVQPVCSKLPPGFAMLHLHARCSAVSTTSVSASQIRHSVQCSISSMLNCFLGLSVYLTGIWGETRSRQRYYIQEDSILEVDNMPGDVQTSVKLWVMTEILDIRRQIQPLKRGEWVQKFFKNLRATSLCAQNGDIKHPTFWWPTGTSISHRPGKFNRYGDPGTEFVQLWQSGLLKRDENVQNFRADYYHITQPARLNLDFNTTVLYVFVISCM